MRAGLDVHVNVAVRGVLFRNSVRSFRSCVPIRFVIRTGSLACTLVFLLLLVLFFSFENATASLYMCQSNTTESATRNLPCLFGSFHLKALQGQRNAMPGSKKSGVASQSPTSSFNEIIRCQNCIAKLAQQQNCTNEEKLLNNNKKKTINCEETRERCNKRTVDRKRTAIQEGRAFRLFEVSFAQF